jgi:ABC-type glycerol-3-phosphate transport system permease component
MKRRDVPVHIVLCMFLFLTMVPFIFVINNSLRSNSEIYHAFFGLPAGVKSMARCTWLKLSGRASEIELKVVADEEAMVSKYEVKKLGYGAAMATLWKQLTKGYLYAWTVLRPYMINSIFVSTVTVCFVLLLGSFSGYVFSRYRFPGRNALFVVLLSIIMIPGILTLVPSFFLVKKLGLLNSYWVLILPYLTGGQIFATFLFKGFFDALPEELFESARLDGAGHFSLYWHIVLPLSKQVIAVVAVMNILGTWNNFLWPFITNSDSRYHVVSSGLFIMGSTQVASNLSTMFAAYILASIPLLVLFVYATKPFMQGVTSGAFKA